MKYVEIFDCPDWDKNQRIQNNVFSDFFSIFEYNILYYALFLAVFCWQIFYMTDITVYAMLFLRYILDSYSFLIVIMKRSHSLDGY